ncbi:ABC transporter permease [Psychromonas algicola]|uniref:ABC transporter permease n=1 Tax=Psychromonas algicola TaxID=2555642 RepID=UPI0010672F7A|nr:ABC transporter permease [Psychromonas sp. RZ5]TEW51519.1 ABC transporter permease [Psychromonas sp. RZ5]
MNLFNLFKLELKAIFSNSAIILTVFGGVVFYSFLYPLPYATQTPREQKVTVVNLDNSLLSYQLERMADATPEINVVSRTHSIESAKQEVMQGNASGILVIPNDFYRDLLLGKSPTLSYAGDASYFLVYGTIVKGLASVGGTVAAKVKVSQLVIEGEALALAQTQFVQTSINMKPTFNPTNGYINYVVPAVFVLILQQTLVMGIGLLGGTEKSSSGYWSQTSTFKLLSVRCFIFVSIYYLLALYYFGFSFDFYGINLLASSFDLLFLLFPFLLTSCFIGIVLGAVLPRRELVTLVVLISSMPLIFSAGFIWPLQSIPQPIIWLSNLFPSTPAMQAFLSVNQMGASLSQVMQQSKLLWLQSLGWGAVAYFTYSHVQGRVRAS